MLFALLTLSFIHFCALITPGPDFFLVTQSAIGGSRRQALAAVLGITVGVMFWAILALLGLNIIFEKMVWLRKILLIGGGIYLCWLGFQLLRSAFAKPTAMQAQQAAMQQQDGAKKYFIKGLLTNLSNPKAVIYFGSVFSLFLANPALNHVHSLLFIIVSVETLIWFLFVSFIFSRARFKRLYQNSTKWIDGISGGIFSAFGIFLISHR